MFDQDGSWSAAFDLEAMTCGFRPSIFVGSSDERDQKRLNCLKELYAIKSDLSMLHSRSCDATGVRREVQLTSETSSARCSTGCFSEDFSGKVTAVVDIASKGTVQRTRRKYIQTTD